MKYLKIQDKMKNMKQSELHILDHTWALWIKVIVLEYHIFLRYWPVWHQILKRAADPGNKTLVDSVSSIRMWEPIEIAVLKLENFMFMYLQLYIG